MSKLFDSLTLGALDLRNRIVMAPMTRRFSPQGTPGGNVASYYRRRAEGGVGLIITEGLEIRHGGSVYDSAIPNFFEDDALKAWTSIFDEVHAAGSKIIPQLWHVGGARAYQPKTHRPEAGAVAPSGIYKPGEVFGEPMTAKDIDAVIEAYASAAQCALALGADGIELHGAHGYLIDQFLWGATNARIDAWGGDPVGRTRFACDIVRECRRRTTPTFPIFLRFSQWKIQDYGARLAETASALESILAPLTDAGVDVYDCSTRRFWQPEFPGSDMNLAGWTKAVTGKPTMTVGSVGLDNDVVASLGGGEGSAAGVAGLDQLERMLERGDFDLVGVGRAILADSHWVEKIQHGRVGQLKPFTTDDLLTLS
jgi:2,4-dienoyl-CoA reductase-like NADH-dependent reductase (Old Yellow Enzyme family)